MSTNLTVVLQQLLQNTSNLKVLQQLMTPDATYVSLNFDNPELKKIEPWAGTHKGPQALPGVFAAIQRFWKTLDFKVTDTIEQGNRVALFGSFTYKSNVTGKEITSPFACWHVSRGTRLLTSSSSRTPTAPPAHSRQAAAQDFIAIPREKKLRSSPVFRDPYGSTSVRNRGAGQTTPRASSHAFSRRGFRSDPRSLLPEVHQQGAVT